MRALALPFEVTSNAGRQEILRVWIDEGQMSLTHSLTIPVGKGTPTQRWAILLSDIAHHVVDAVSQETGSPKEELLERLRGLLFAVKQSQRGGRKKAVERHAGPLKKLPVPRLDDPDTAVEFVRVFHVPGHIHMILLTGLWLEDGQEEDNWANLIYDIASILASEYAVSEQDVDFMRAQILGDVLKYLDDPTTDYSGRFF